MSERSQRITEKAISSAQLDVIISNKPIILWCKQLRGFGVRIAPAGKKYPKGKTSYLVQKHIAGRKSREIRFTFGEYPSLPLVEAYNLAHKYIAQIRNGENPSEERQSLLTQRRTEYEQFKTSKFSLIFEKYRQAKIAEKGPTKYFTKHIINNFNRYVHPLIGKKALQEITKEDIRVLLNSITKLPTRRVVHAQLAPVFQYAITEDIIKVSPMDGLQLPAPSKPRDRVLARDEIKALWLATGEMIGSPKPVFAHLCRALLLSAGRLNELAKLSHDEINQDGQFITFPSKRMKNGKPFVLPVTALLKETLEAAPKKHNKWVYSYGKTPLSDSITNAKDILDEKMERYLGRPLEPWVIHSIRHSFSTVMASRGMNLEHISLCLAHTPKMLKGIDGNYIHYAFLKEKRIVMENWAQYVDECIAAQ